MSDLYRVIGVGKTAVNREQWWGVSQRGPQDLPQLHVFPPYLLVHRAVEYGVDPADSRTLLDLVLHERFLTHAEMDPDAPDFVYNCDPVTALRAHRARLDTVRQRARVVDPDGLLNQIHDAHVVDPAVVQRARAYVEHSRRSARLKAAANG